MKKIIINPDGYYPQCPYCYSEQKSEEAYCHECGQEIDWSDIWAFRKWEEEIKQR